MKKVFVRLAISLSFIGLLFYMMRDKLPEIVSTLQQANHGLIALAAAIFVSSTLIFAKRLQLIFYAENIVVSLKDLTHLSFIGYFFNNFLPTSVGGDIVKAMCASRLTREPLKSVTTILMDRIFGLFTFILIPSVSLLFYLKEVKNPSVPIAVYSLLAFSIFCFFLIFNRDLARKFNFIETMLRWVRLDKKIRKVYDGLHEFKDRKMLIFKAIVLSVLGQAIGLWLIYLLGRAIEAETELIYYFLLIPVVQLLAMLPSLNGLGIREGAYVYFMGPLMGSHKAFALGILWLFMLFIMSLIGGVVYLFRHDLHVQFKGRVNEYPT